jgi:hypothetical protein
MPALAFSALDVLLVVGLGAAGFLVVALVCAGVLAMLQLILPAADSGAADVDRRQAAQAEAAAPETDAGRDA